MTNESENPEPKPIPPEAHRAGTVNALNRARQYSRADASELLRSLNEAWSKIRLVEQENRRKDVELGLLRGAVQRYRWVNIALTAIITTLAWEGLKLVVPMGLRWLGVN